MCGRRSHTRWVLGILLTLGTSLRHILSQHSCRLLNGGSAVSRVAVPPGIRAGGNTETQVALLAGVGCPPPSTAYAILESIYCQTGEGAVDALHGKERCLGQGMSKW